MQACDGLKNMILHHYDKFEASEQPETMQEMSSLQDGMLIVGNDPNERRIFYLKHWYPSGTA